MSNPKPLPLRLREAKEGIIAAVNAALKEQALPCYLLEPIIADVHTQISTTAAREYEIAAKEYEAAGEGGDNDGP